jgi:hypothetical protein
MLKVDLVKKNETEIVANPCEDIVKKWHMKSHVSSNYWNRFYLWSRVWVCYIVKRDATLSVLTSLGAQTN